MKPAELSIMLKQWAQANAPTYDLTVEGVDVALLGVADSGMLADDGERGGVFPISVATVTVRPQPFTLEAFMAEQLTIKDLRRRSVLIDEFQRLYFSLCHEIWMVKDIAIRGRVLLVN